MNILNGLKTREDFDRKIQELEDGLAVLKANRPRAVQRFFLFKGHPFRSCMIYAGNEETAKQKLFDRYADQFGPDVLKVHGVCSVFDDAEHANNNCGSSRGLMQCLSENDAKAFLQDWQIDHPTIAIPKARRLSTLEREIYAYEESRRRERTLVET